MDVYHQIAQELKDHIYPKNAPIPDWYLDATAEHIKETAHRILEAGDGRRTDWNGQGLSLFDLFRSVNAQLDGVARWSERRARTGVDDDNFPDSNLAEDFMSSLSYDIVHAVIDYHVAKKHAEMLTDAIGQDFIQAGNLRELFEKLQDQVLNEYAAAHNLEPLNLEAYHLI